MLIPWEVDVAQDRYPVVNGLIILATVAVFLVQVQQLMASGNQETSTITEALLLNGWHLKGLLGHIWLHGGFVHILGNMVFLWVFGNAVCAKVGNIHYFFIYLLLGIAAGMAHLAFSDHPALGASGAINGVVGMFLFLYPRNDVTCVFFILIIKVYSFTVDSFKIILWWLFWDFFGFFFCTNSSTAYMAHIGGFAAGFGLAFLMYNYGWIPTDRWEESLWERWDKRKRQAREAEASIKKDRESLTPGMDYLQNYQAPSPQYVTPAPETPPISITWDPTIRFHCKCGRRIKVHIRYAGRKGTCPNCKQRIKIPDQDPD